MSSILVTPLGSGQLAEGSNSVTFEVDRISGSLPTYQVYWGTTDGGTTPGSWDHSSAIFTAGSASVTATVTISPLLPRTLYYYNVRANSDAVDFWFNNPAGSKTTWSVDILKVMGYETTRLGSLVQSKSLMGRWAMCHQQTSLLVTFQGSDIHAPSVADARYQVTAHTTTPGHYTVPSSLWSSSGGLSNSNVSVSGVIASTNLQFALVPSPVGLGGAVDGDSWLMKKGAWKLSASINVNGSFYDKDPAAGGVAGGPYPVTLIVFPYSVFKRPKRGNPAAVIPLPAAPLIFSTTIAAGGATWVKRVNLRSDVMWLAVWNLTVWANQSNEGSPVSNVDIAVVDIQGTRT